MGVQDEFSIKTCKDKVHVMAQNSIYKLFTTDCFIYVYHCKKNVDWDLLFGTAELKALTE